MKSFQRTILFFSLCSLLFLTGCIVKDSPAPGCVEYIGFSPIGGCNGKTIITDLTLEGFPECVQMTINNCNGGVLEVQNDCSETLILGKLEIPPGESFNLDVQTVSDGGFVLVRTPSNFSNYTPGTDQSVQITGTIGNQTLSMFFLKTAPLCE